MKKRVKRLFSMLLTVSMLLGAVTPVSAAEVNAVDATTSAESEVQNAELKETPKTEANTSENQAGETKTSAETNVSDTKADAPAENVPPAETPKEEVPNAENKETPSQEVPSENPPAGTPTQNAPSENPSAETPEADKSTEVPETETEKKDVSGEVSVDKEDVAGSITVEADKNDDNVEIKKNDKPYLALGADLTPEQKNTVLAIMGIDPSQLDNYDVVYVNNSEEHQYLDSYIDKSKIGTRSLSSVVIMERKDGNGINISTNNVSYCTVGMYKNALATAGIQNADIIVAAPFAISGTAALVGVFKAYENMTGETIKEENVDTALNELVLTGALKESTGVDSDEIEGMIAYVKQAVVEHDLKDEADIRDAIQQACEKFDITLTEEEVNEVVDLMLKIGDLDLDLDSLLNAAQSIYDKIANADGGFWAKIREILISLIEKVKEVF